MTTPLNTHAKAPAPVPAMNMSVTLENLDILLEGIGELQIKKAGPLWLSLLQGKEQFLNALREAEHQKARQAQLDAENELDINVQPADAPAVMEDAPPEA